MKKRILVGKVTRVHGLQGKLCVHLTFRHKLPPRIPIYFKQPSNDVTLFQMVKLSALPKKNRTFLLQTKELTSIEEAKPWVGSELFVDVSSLPRLPQGTFYDHELLDLMVVDLTGKGIGRIVGVLENPGHDLYVVQGKDKEHLIPAVSEIVKQVDLEGHVIRIDPPEGLLDL